MRVVSTLTGMSNVSVTLYLDPILDKSELQNTTPKNRSKVGAAIIRRRLKRECDVTAVVVDVH